MTHVPVEITSVYAYLIVQDDGGEGVPAYRTPEGVWQPMMGADLERIESLRPLAQTFANRLGRPLRLVQFTAPKVLEIFSPEAV